MPLNVPPSSIRELATTRFSSPHAPHLALQRYSTTGVAVGVVMNDDAVVLRSSIGCPPSPTVDVSARSRLAAAIVEMAEAPARPPGGDSVVGTDAAVVVGGLGEDVEGEEAPFTTFGER
jgi:hypothetical protein